MPDLSVVGRLNPVRGVVLSVGLLLARVGAVDAERARETTELSWPRILTGVARKSKGAVDIAMVGTAVGPAAIAGIGFTSPYWGLAFVVGGGLSTGVIALVSQCFGAKAFDRLEQTIRSSVLLVVAVTLPLSVVMWSRPTSLVAALSSDPLVVELGATYLRIVALGVPFAAVNLVGGRVLIGADDAWTPMVLRAGGAATNIGLNAVLIFGFGMGVAGAAIGTVLANVAVAVAFAVGLLFGRLPVVGRFPVRIGVRGRYVDRGVVRDVLDISLPATGRRLVWTAARFPLLTFVGLFGPSVVAAYIISRRVWDLLNTPGWGFGLAASSLVGRALGTGDEATAEAYGHEITRIAVVTYLVGAAAVFTFAEPVVLLFVTDPSPGTVDVAVTLVYAACLAVVARGVGGTYAGALDATGDTRWPFYSRVVGMFGVTLPVAYLGATTGLGLTGLVLSYFGMSVVPAVVNAFRFSTGRWKRISRRYRPGTVAADD